MADLSVSTVGDARGGEDHTHKAGSHIYTHRIIVGLHEGKNTLVLVTISEKVRRLSFLTLLKAAVFTYFT